MIPSITAVRLTGAADRAELPLLVLGPVEGTAAIDLWLAHVVAATAHFDVIALDLPGQGYNAAAPSAAPTVEELAAGVLAVVDDVREQRDDQSAFDYVGVGLGAEIGERLLVEAEGRVRVVALDAAGALTGVLGLDVENEDDADDALDARTLALVSVGVLAARGSVPASALARAEAAGMTAAELRAVVEHARSV